MSPIDPNRDAILYEVLKKEVVSRGVAEHLGDPKLVEFDTWFYHDSQNSSKGTKEGGLEIMVKRITNLLDKKMSEAVSMFKLLYSVNCLRVVCTCRSRSTSRKEATPL